MKVLTVVTLSPFDGFDFFLQSTYCKAKISQNGLKRIHAKSIQFGK